MKPGACTGPYSLCGKSWKQSIYNPRANTSKNRALKTILARRKGTFSSVAGMDLPAQPGI